MWQGGNQSASDYLWTPDWKLRILLGTHLNMPAPERHRHVWTDIQIQFSDDTPSNPVVGDFNGDDAVNTVDDELKNAYVRLHDGGPWDTDGLRNGCVHLLGFPYNFMIFDTNYDGKIGDCLDAIIMAADFDQDGTVDRLDFVVMHACWQYPRMALGADASCKPTDLNLDARLDLRDLAAFSNELP